MNVLRCTSPQEFLERSWDYRANEPIRTNVISSVAMSVVTSPDRYDAYWWWLIEDDAHVVVGAAFRTAPFGLHLGPMPRAAASILADAVSTSDPDLPFVVGVEELLRPFLAAFTRLTTRAFARGRSNLLYELDTLTIPDVDGAIRRVTLDDEELVVQWFDDFHYFIEGTAREPDERDRAAIRRLITSDSMRFWCVDNVAVAMAGHAPSVTTPVGVRALRGV